MPSVSQKQHNFMEWKAHAKGVSLKTKKVAQEFVAADKGTNLKKLPVRVAKGRTVK